MKSNRLERITVAFYCILLAGFVLFAVYMFCFERNQVYSAREFGGSGIVEPEGEKTIADSSAPAGIHREFTWTMPECAADENCLAFYVVHHYAQVWFDDVPVYSLSPGPDNHIGGSPSSNWILIPVFPGDSGRKVTVLLTPAYESVVSRRIEFLLGSRFSILAAQLKTDLPQLALSALCILIGFLLMGAQLLMLRHKKASDWELLCLGLFVLLVGVWRITDTRFSPILLSRNPMALGYITIGALFLIVAPILLYMKAFYRGSEKLILSAALLICVSSAAVLLCQIFGIAELRQTLFVAHISMIVCLAVLLVVSVRCSITDSSQPGTWKLLLVLAVSSVADLIYFYIRGNSSGVLFTVFALVVFAVYKLIDSVLKVNRKAYTDVRTGLFNKNRWDELMKNSYGKEDSIGVIMIDLNRLKYVNDTQGHAMGDRMILNFANILRNTIPPSNTICRWGGDEFTIMIMGASQEKMEQAADAIAEAVANYNATDELPKIHYACGWALSSEFPGLSPSELLVEADKRMYLDKRRWYEANAGKQ